jgi:hypothetical protein
MDPAPHRARPARALLMTDSTPFLGLVALAALVALSCAASACTPFKAREADKNEGGGSSMYRSAQPPGAH